MFCFNRLARIKPDTSRGPNVSSKRPADVNAVTWAGVGLAVQERELERRNTEQEGGRLSQLSEEYVSKLPESV